jgi:hypothetical protein
VARVETVYRTVILRLYPTPKQEKMLKRAEAEVLKFLEIGRRQLQKLIYHKAAEAGVAVGRYSLSLLAQRFTGSLGNKAIIPLNTAYNARFICENGIWFLEAQLLKGRGNRVRIPVAKTENKYYAAIGELDGLPLYVTRENDQWFAYVSIPVSAENNGRVIGVDFNVMKWVAAPAEGGPVLFFDASWYSREIDRLQRLRARFQSKGDLEGVQAACRSMLDIVKLAHGNFLARIQEKFGVCVIGMESVETLYKLTEKDNTMINNWLYSKTALRQFALRAMAKGFEVIEIDPKDTTRVCHRCGAPVKVNGRRGRSITCTSCDLTNYHRDLNAARNIARKAAEEWAKRVESRKQLEKLEPIEIAANGGEKDENKVKGSDC